MKTNGNQKDILLKIGRNIRHYRNKRGLSQEQLAFECELHRTYIGSIERGERNITITNLIKIKDNLGVTLNDLYPK